MKLTLTTESDDERLLVGRSLDIATFEAGITVLDPRLIRRIVRILSRTPDESNEDVVEDEVRTRILQQQRRTQV